MTKESFSLRLILSAVVLSLVSGFLGGAFAVSYIASNSPKADPAPSKRVSYVEESQVIDTVKTISPSVVSIVISKDLPDVRNQVFNFNDLFNGDPYGSPFAVPEAPRDENGKLKTTPRKIGGGSGFIATSEGLVVTNRHVVEDADAEYTVVLSDQREFSAEVLSRDTVNDIAVLQLKDKNGKDPQDLPAATLGDSADMQIGQRVVAIGNALSEYANTVTTGVISAKGRSIVAGSVNSTENLLNLFQTDAAINPGNSGGPLVNLEGEVIGINTAIASGAQGIGFAIPINDVKSVIESVKLHGKIIRPYLGVRFMMLDEAKAKELQIDVKNGALLTGDEANGEFAVVPGSPADKAGLKLKDVILSVDGQDVTLENPLHVIVAKKQPGDVVSLKVWRSGETLDLKVALTESK